MTTGLPDQRAAVSIVMINRNGGAALQRAIATCRIAIEQARPLSRESSS